MTNQKPNLKTYQNLESAFAGESMAYQRYLYFAKLARKKGYEEVAAVFEKTAGDEIGHAEGHLRFLYPEDSLSVEDLLKIAIQGETYEYTEMYPGFAKTANSEGQTGALAEFNEQIGESSEHAARFKAVLPKIERLFAGLAKVEEHHAKGYEKALAGVAKKTA